MEQSNQYVVFTLDEQRYALHLAAVERIIPVVEITPLPKAPDLVLGIINVGGQIIPVIDTRKRFRLPERELNLSDVLITADCGGSNGYRVRLWKVELQGLANEFDMEINVCHFPPGTSKWNKIEHKMFSYISENWRGRPLITKETVVKLISGTRTKKGLEIRSMLDENIYEKGIKITDDEMTRINIVKSKFHGEWNYKILPQIDNSI